MPQNILIDTGFWFSFFGKDKFTPQAHEIFPVIEEHNLLIPWPTLYETLNTSFVKNARCIQPFEKLLDQKNVFKIADDDYKSNALQIMSTYVKQKRSLSLVDIMIRYMLQDVNLKVHAFVTFNVSDFHDICYKQSIELLNGL